MDRTRRGRGVGSLAAPIQRHWHSVRGQRHPDDLHVVGRVHLNGHGLTGIHPDWRGHHNHAWRRGVRQNCHCQRVSGRKATLLSCHHRDDRQATRSWATSGVPNQESGDRIDPGSHRRARPQAVADRVPSPIRRRELSNVGIPCQHRTGCACCCDCRGRVRGSDHHQIRLLTHQTCHRVGRRHCNPLTPELVGGRGPTEYSGCRGDGYAQSCCGCVDTVDDRVPHGVDRLNRIGVVPSLCGQNWGLRRYHRRAGNRSRCDCHCERLEGHGNPVKRTEHEGLRPDLVHRRSPENLPGACVEENSLRWVQQRECDSGPRRIRGDGEIGVLLPGGRCVRWGRGNRDGRPGRSSHVEDVLLFGCPAVAIVGH